MPLLDWKDIDLVIFDVDGTLYDQRRLQLAMLRRLLVATWQTRSLDTLLTLRTFRRVRESLGEQPGADFMTLQYARTARQRHKTEDEVRALVAQWRHRRRHCAAQARPVRPAGHPAPDRRAARACADDWRPL